MRDFKENNNIFKEKLDRKLKLQKKGWDLGNKYSKKNLNPNHDIRRFKTEEAKSPKREKMEEEEAKKMGLDYLKYSRAHAKKQKDKDKEKSVTLLSELDNEKAVNTNEKGTDMSILEKSVKIKPKDVGLPDDVDYIEELEKEAKKGAKLKNYNDLKSLKGRIKIVEARGLNEYEKLKYAYDLKEYMKEAESGDRMLIGAMKSKLGLISRMEPKMKNLKIKGKKEVDEGGEEGNGDVDV